MVPTSIESHQSVFPGKTQHNLTENSVYGVAQLDHYRTHALNKGIQRLRKTNLSGAHQAKGYLHHKYRLKLLRPQR
jgi:hypothetical protein